MCVPLWNNKEIIGVIYADRMSLVRAVHRRRPAAADPAGQPGRGQDRERPADREAIEKETHGAGAALAAQIQKDLLPKEIPIAENSTSPGEHPCHQVGGDYYDFIPIDPCRMGIAIADVSGKGVSASLLMASLRAALHVEIRPQLDLAEMAAKLNDFVHRSSAINGFITFFFGELDLETGRLRYVNAGHNPPILLDARGGIARLEPGGFCLGMFPSVVYEAREASLDVGDSVILYTDGITDSRDKDDREFGEERLIELVRQAGTRRAEKIVETVCGELSSFTAGAPPFDDMTLVILKRTG